jgi:hypothetical protein
MHPDFPCLGGFIFSIRNKNGSAIIVAILISAVFLIGAAVITTYFHDYLKVIRLRKIDQENYRIGQELARAVGEAYERQIQYSGVCPVGDTAVPAISPKFCFAAQPQVVSPIYNNKTVGLDLTASQILSLNTSSNQNIYVFNGFSAPGKSWPWSFLLPESWGQSVQFKPQFGAVPVNTYTAVDCSAPGNPLCHKCSPTDELCFQLRYCSIEQPGVTSVSADCPNNFISQDIAIRSTIFY